MGAKDLIFSCAKYGGLFNLSRWLTRGQLRILCYHGFSYADEHEFQSLLFMSPDQFRERMQYLADNQFNVLPLAAAMEQLAADDLPPRSVVITMDDGWQGVADFAWPILKEFGFPATCYVTTYYVVTQIPVVNVFCKYLVWKTKHKTVDMSRVDPAFTETCDLTIDNQRTKAAAMVIRHADDHLKPIERAELCERFADVLEVDLEPLTGRAFRLMNMETVQRLHKDGLDIQLHTHRHRPPRENEMHTREELTRNRELLADIATEPLEHFCFPGGLYNADQLPVLADIGIKTATTTQHGLVTKHSDPLQLPRLLDGADVSRIDFLADLYGVKSLVKSVTGRA